MLNLPCKCPKCGNDALVKGMQELPKKNLVLIECNSCGSMSDELKRPIPKQANNPKLSTVYDLAAPILSGAVTPTR